MLFIPRENGNAMVEYVVVIFLVLIVVVAIILFLGPAITNVFENILVKI